MQEGPGRERAIIPSFCDTRLPNGLCFDPGRLGVWDAIKYDYGVLSANLTTAHNTSTKR